MAWRPYARFRGADLSWDQEDVELLAGIARCDSDSLLRLYRKYNHRVFSLVYRILGDRPAAEEVLQVILTFRGNSSISWERLATRRMCPRFKETSK